MRLHIRQGRKLVNFQSLGLPRGSHACCSQILAANLVHNDILNVEVRCRQRMCQRVSMCGSPLPLRMAHTKCRVLYG